MIFIPTTNEKLAQDISSLYVYMPENTRFSVSSTHLTAVELKDLELFSKDKFVYLTKDGWIWQDKWEIIGALTIGALTTRPVITGSDGMWRYRYSTDHCPILTCKKVNWNELKLKALFS